MEKGKKGDSPLIGVIDFGMKKSTRKETATRREARGRRKEITGCSGSKMLTNFKNHDYKTKESFGIVRSLIEKLECLEYVDVVVDAKLKDLEADRVKIVKEDFTGRRPQSGRSLKLHLEENIVGNRSSCALGRKGRELQEGKISMEEGRGLPLGISPGRGGKIGKRNPAKK